MSDVNQPQPQAQPQPMPQADGTQAQASDNQVSNPGVPMQQPQPQVQPQQPQQQQGPAQAQLNQQSAGQPSQAQTGTDGGTVSNPQNPAMHPSVARAGVLHEIAQTLAGGPRYQTTVDPNTGEIKRTAVPLKGSQIGLAIAMEALMGGLAGLGAKGPNHIGQAFQLGAQQGQQIAQQAEQQDFEDARQQQNDRVNALAKKAAALESNLRTRNLAQEIGMRDETAHQAFVAAHASTADTIRNDYSDAVIKDNASEAEVTNPEFVKQAMQNGWVAIPVGYTPRFAPDGSHYSPDGVPMHDSTFMVVDSRKIKIPADVIAGAQKWSLPGFSDREGQPLKGLDDVELRVSSIADTSNKIATLDQEQRDLTDYYGYLAAHGVKGADGKPLEANLQDMVRKNPSLIRAITSEWSRHFGDSSSDALKAMKDDNPVKGQIANLYGGTAMLQKYDLLRDADKESTKAEASGEKQVRAATVRHLDAETDNARQANAATPGQPDALGFVPPQMPQKEQSKRFASMKKQADGLAQTEQTYTQFQNAIKAIDSGNYSGAQSIVSLFDAIGISATPLAGRGFRVNQSIVREHEQARGWLGSLQQKLLGVKAGDVITPQQLRDYASIASQARQAQYTAAVNEAHNAGLNADFVLPTGNGQRLDADTAKIFLNLTGGDANKARAAAQRKGWTF